MVVVADAKVLRLLSWERLDQTDDVQRLAERIVFAHEQQNLGVCESPLQHACVVFVAVVVGKLTVTSVSCPVLQVLRACSSHVVAGHHWNPFWGVMVVLVKANYAFDKRPSCARQEFNESDSNFDQEVVKVDKNAVE